MAKRAEKSGLLFQVAESQQGYFTSADAKKLGYDYPHQHFHVKQGNWIRVDHGIYRLKNFPAAGHEDLMRWWLWSRKKGVISHETAAALYELGDLLPSKVHLTVPQDFRKKPGKGVVLHRSSIDGSEIEKRDGFPVTSPLRTIMDVAKTRLDPERLSAVVKDAVQKGLIVRGALLDALTKMPEGIDASTHATLQLASSVERGGEYISQPNLDETPRVREPSNQFAQSGLSVGKVVAEIKSGLRSIYGDLLKGVYLFGSYARGDADRESDLDVLVILADFERCALEVDRTAELIGDLSLKQGVSVSLVFMREREWVSGDTPFLSNVRDEAIPA